MGKSTLILTAGALAAGFAFAQDQPQGEGPDVPSRAARLSFLQGTVSFQPASVEDWVPATLNRPITTGDRLWTENGSRAELHLGSAAFRLNGRSNFSFINLDDRTAQVQLSLGTLSVRVRRLADDETMEIDTPQAALSILRPGEYRIEVNEQGDTTIVTVRGGEIEATAGQAFNIHPRDQVRITGTDPSTATFDRREIPVADPFDNWCADRDRREDMSQSSRYVSREMPGYADLDDNGGWREYPDYGAVWFPRTVAVGWAPYRFGHWAWVAPWGWTWVDDAPWGYAPFHYGRWVFVAGGWGWVPGPVVVGVRPVYAPALVAWVGGPRFGVAVGFGGGVAAVGWFALGPREVFVPSYHYSPAYVERVNVTNTVIVNRTVINNINVTNVNYVNRNVPGAVTAVSHDTMVSGRPVGVSSMRVQPSALQQAQVVQHAGVVPQREAVLEGRTPVGAAPPAAFANRTVVTRTPPPPPPVAFQRQQTALQQNQGRPLPPSAMTQIRQSAPPPQQPRPMYRQAPAIQTPQPQSQQPNRQFQQPTTPPANPPFQPRPERTITPPPQPQIQPRNLEKSTPPAQPQEQRKTFERTPPQPQQQERTITPPPQQPRNLEKSTPPSQPQQERKTFERTPPVPQPERTTTPPDRQKQIERREEKQPPKRDDRREKEKEKGR